MISAYRLAEDGTTRLERYALQADEKPSPDTVWIDLLKPTTAEEAMAEHYIGIDIPTREDMKGIEPSELLFVSRGLSTMTARLLCGSQTEQPYVASVTFILGPKVLVTVRYQEIFTFGQLAQRVGREDEILPTASGVLAALVEAISDRSADVLQQAGERVDQLSKLIFSGDVRQKTNRQLETLRALGRVGDLLSHVRETLVSVERMLRFISNEGHARCAAPELLNQAKTTLRDHQSLEEHAGFVAAKVQFLLDAILGLVNLEQNNIIKLFSVIAVVLTPPTLIASIYGMNFKLIPELQWDYGYLYAICLMLASAILPYVYFKWRKWL